MSCSEFTSAAFKNCGVEMPSIAREQFNLLNSSIKREKLQKGDLVFFALKSSKISHVGIAINDSIFIHSPGINKAVRLDNVNTEYWSKYFFCCVNPLNESEK